MTLRAVFVCSGNICRSPMGAGLAKAALAERSEPAIIISCGTLNINGRPAAAHAITAMDELGIDISSHYSQGVAVGLLKMADYIVVMAPMHERALIGAASVLQPKIVRMWEFAPKAMSKISDPVGRDLDAFRGCRDLLVHCVSNWLDEVLGKPAA